MPGTEVLSLIRELSFHVAWLKRKKEDILGAQVRTETVERRESFGLHQAASVQFSLVA